MAWKPTNVRLFKTTSAPGVTDDMNDGYEVGDCIVDETNDNSYQCQDNTVGAAVWAQIDLGGGVGSGSLTTIKEDNVQVGDADIVTLDFLGADFDLAESPNTEVQVVIAAAIARAADVVTKALFDANTILAANSDNTPAALTIAEQRIVGRITSGNIVGLTAAQILTLIGVASGADVTGSNAPQAHKDSHDPDGSDPLDAAAASALLEVQAGAEGSASTWARSDHDHAIVHDITDNSLVTIDGTSNAPVNTDYAKFTTLGLEGMTKAQMLSDLNVADGADVTGSNAPQAHKDSHDPGGSDPLDAGSPNAILEVQAQAEGSAETWARSDHDHAIVHDITDNSLATVDGTSNAPVNSDYAKWTANGLEGMEKSQILSDLNVADGADVTGSNAPQAHKDSHDPGGSDPLDAGSPNAILEVQAQAEGSAETWARSDHDHAIVHDITENSLVTIDDANVADNEYARFTASGLESRTPQEVVADLFAAKTLFVFTPLQNVPPTSNYATLDTFAAATGFRMVLDFDGTAANETAIFEGVWPSTYAGGGVNVILHYSLDGTDPQDVQFEVSIEVVQDDDDQDAGGQDFGAATDITDTPATNTANYSNITAPGAISHANCGSPAVGDRMRLKVTRDYDHAANTDDVQLHAVHIKEQ